MSTWIDDFESNKLNPKWVATRYSQGGQNNGVWTREIKDSKIYWKPVDVGTETQNYGELLTLPLNAPGDVRIDALVRMKRTTAIHGFLSMGVNNGVIAAFCRNGVRTYLGGGVVNYLNGILGLGTTLWPGFPSKNELVTTSDELLKFTIVRKNGYIFLYNRGIYMGFLAFAPTITDFNFEFTTFTNNYGVEMWVDWVKITPSSVVL